jgi:hypothetical protein
MNLERINPMCEDHEKEKGCDSGQRPPVVEALMMREDSKPSVFISKGQAEPAWMKQ